MKIQLSEPPNRQNPPCYILFHRTSKWVSYGELQCKCSRTVWIQSSCSCFSHLKWWTSLWASRLFSELWPAPPGSSSSLHGLNNQTQGTRMGLSLVDWRHPLILGISKKRSTKTRWMVANIDKLSQLHRPCDFFWVDSPQSQHVTAQRRSCSYPPAPKKSSRASSIHLPYGCMQTAWLPAPLNIFKYLQLSSTHSSKWIKMFVVHF